MEITGHVNWPCGCVIVFVRLQPIGGYSERAEYCGDDTCRSRAFISQHGDIARHVLLHYPTYRSTYIKQNQAILQRMRDEIAKGL